MDPSTSPTEGSIPSAPSTNLSQAVGKHGITLTADQARMGTEWRNAMVNSVGAVRRLNVDGYEPAATFKPVTHPDTNRGG